MDSGQCSRDTCQGDSVWAKLVSSDSNFPEVEISTENTLICSQVNSSSSEEVTWCEIKRSSDKDTVAIIRDLSSKGIIVDGNLIGEEAVEIKTGSQIIAGPNSEEYMSYSFQMNPSQDMKSIKIQLDVEHAKCSICLNIWHDVVTVSPCLHNFCNGCFSEWLRRNSKGSVDKASNITCPQCRAIVHSVGKNHFLRNIEEAILESFSSLKRTDEEIALLDTYASVKSNLVLGSKKNPRKRPFSSSSSSDGSNNSDLPCPQCGIEFGGFRCNSGMAHLQCNDCGNLMPSRPNSTVPQNCQGCNRVLCGAYWNSQGLDSNQYNLICQPGTFKPIAERTISRIPDSAHENNPFEREITERCIQQSGKTLQAVISDWIVKFDNSEMDRSRLPLCNPDTITSNSHLCNNCYTTFVSFLLYWYRVSLPNALLPHDAAERENCWYGFSCRTQHHNTEHARKRNHVCRPTRGNIP
ncbi:hypothetical protein LUZ60_007766 [Juncus effusus]|nr:hypothetical protein LUZ60_007766 [Juncus effusus]